MKKSKIAISFKSVHKHFPIQTERTAKELIPSLIRGGKWANQKEVFTGISFDVNVGESVGVIGRNGAGKSTMLKLIAGVTYPNLGEVVVNGTVAPLIELGAGFHHELTGLENIYLNGAILGLTKQQIEENINEIIKFSGLKEYIHTPIKRYSTGMQMRLAFSVAIQTPAPILLIDEVLAVGDMEFQEKCLKSLDKIKKEGQRTIVFVSHNEKDVRSFCNRVILIEAGSIIVDGSPDQAYKKYQDI